MEKNSKIHNKNNNNNNNNNGNKKCEQKNIKKIIEMRNYKYG